MDKDIFEVETFCINPSLDKYKRLSSSKHLRNILGASFDIWDACVRFKYSEEWSLKPDPDHETNIDNLYKSTTKKTCNRSVLYKLWHMFFATGELKPALLAYKLAGEASYDRRFCDVSIDLYIRYNELYRKEDPTNAVFLSINESIKKSENEIKLNMLTIDTGVIVPDKSKPEDFSKTAETLAPEDKSLEKKKKVKEASKLFDEIGKDIFTKHQVSKK